MPATGRRATAPSEGVGPSRDPAAPRRRLPTQRGRTTGTRGRRGGRARTGGRRAAVAALALPVLGAVVDELAGSSLGWTFAITAAIGSALAALTCSRAGAWWVAYAPPPVVMSITVASEQLAGRTGAHGKGLTTGAVHWAVDAFPAMAAAEVAVLAVLAVRWFRSRRSVRKSGA
ncbi:DUF6542 domain-containing protein [Streptomyces olivoreticuli]